jgi:hypothetical protein
MISEYYKVCTIWLSKELINNKYVTGRLVYVYCVNSDTFREKWMAFIDNTVKDCVKKLYPQAHMSPEPFYSLDELKEKWERCLELPSVDLLLTPDVSEYNLRDAGVRQMNGEEIPPMPAIPVTLYMEMNGGMDGNFYPFNALDLKYPLTLKKEEFDDINDFWNCINKGLVKRLKDVIG